MKLNHNKMRKKNNKMIKMSKQKKIYKIIQNKIHIKKNLNN